MVIAIITRKYDCSTKSINGS